MTIETGMRLLALAYLTKEDLELTDEEIKAIQWICSSRRYIPGMLAIADSSDTHDAAMMLALLNTPREYGGWMESRAFLGMTGEEVYVASGRAERDAIEVTEHTEMIDRARFLNEWFDLTGYCP